MENKHLLEKKTVLVEPSLNHFSQEETKKILFIKSCAEATITTKCNELHLDNNIAVELT